MNNVSSARVIRFPELRERVGLSRTTVWRQIRAGTFPAPVKVGSNAVAWREAEVAAWIAALPSK